MCIRDREWIGKAFPDFKVKDTEGKEWSNTDVTGRPMVLNFWYKMCIRDRLHIAVILHIVQFFPIQITIGSHPLIVTEDIIGKPE